MVFSPGASGFTVTSNPSLHFMGAGITNNAGVPQNFVGNSLAASPTEFFNSANAGNANNNFTITGWLEFADTATAGSATYLNSDNLVFKATSTAGTGTFVNNGNMFIDDSATMANANVTNNSSIYFAEKSSAGTGVITCNGATTAGGAFGRVCLRPTQRRTMRRLSLTRAQMVATEGASVFSDAPMD